MNMQKVIPSKFMCMHKYIFLIDSFLLNKQITNYLKRYDRKFEIEFSDMILMWNFVWKQYKINVQQK